MELYKTDFNLTNELNNDNFYIAKDYLVMDDMTKYLINDVNSESVLNNPKINHLKDKITEIRWVLYTNSSGSVLVFSNGVLNKYELEYLSEWVSGQNSDGLGEGFQNQEFAYIDLDESIGFDWRSDSYKWEKIS